VGTTTRWQIRDDDFGLAIYEGETASAALAAFLRNKVSAAEPGELKVAQFGDGTASVLWRGVEYRKYWATSPG
jgi:hypothetical protein